MSKSPKSPRAAVAKVKVAPAQVEVAKAKVAPAQVVIAKAQTPPAQRVLAKITGAKLCYGKPVEVGAHTVVAVASVRTVGGFGYGKGGDAQSEGSGGGGGGSVDARPVGFIEIGPDGARFHAIDDRRLPLAAIGGGALAAFVIGRLVTRRRRSRVLTPGSSRRRRRKALQAGLS
jgi:hypothetical protein